MNLDLYVITTEIPVLSRTHIDVARDAIAGGATVIQLREKDRYTRDILRIAAEIKKLTQRSGTLFIINDRIDIALAINADGVHLGQEDMPLLYARRILGKGKIIGVSVGGIEEAVRAEREGADYLGVGSIFLTPSKSDAGQPVGLGTLSEIRSSVKTPIVAIGGITLNNIEDVLKAGADGVAVISAVACATDVKRATSELLRKIREVRAKLKEE
ncbi:MAG: thiamine phosphate synthase [Actinomycetota bacterium]|nr:thiamine phosphate synthase [Actinomycetota bacterium]